MPQNYIEIQKKPSSDQVGKILEASCLINKKLLSRGDEKLEFFTLKAPKNIENVLQHDQQVIVSFNKLFEEVEFLRKVNSTSMLLLDEKTKEVEYWKNQAHRIEVSKRNDESRLRDLELENLKLKLNVNNLNERQKGVESRIREVRSGWKSYKEQVEREKRRHKNDKYELLEKLRSKRNNTYQRDEMRKIDGKNEVHTSDLVMQLLSEKESTNRYISQLISFLENLFNCMEKLKASDGNCPIDHTFIAEDSELDGINYTNIDLLIKKLDNKFITLLDEIKAEPFGSEDTFRSKRISKEKKQEIEMLKSQLEELQYNYDKVVQTMEDWKKWKENVS